MEEKERENFYRNSTVIVDLGKEALDALLEDDLSKNNTNLVAFINLNRHKIYHLCYNRQRCCQCVNVVLPTTTPASRVLYPNQLELLLDKSGQKIQGHNPGNAPPCCCSPANPYLITSQLDITLLRCLLINLCNVAQNHSIRQSIEDLVKYRNFLYGHATEAKISDIDYARYQKDLERVLMIIARYCNKENEMKQKLKDAYIRPLDQHICLQYQNTLLSEIQQSKELEKIITNLQVQIAEGEGRVLSRLQTLEDQTDFIGQRMGGFVEHTKARIASIDEDMPIPHKALTHFSSIFHRTNVITVVSKPGGGKSMFCLQYARLIQGHIMYTPVVLVDDEVVKNRDIIVATDKYIYILEDFFGKENPLFNEDVHRNILDILNSCFKQPSCKSKLIFTLRTGQPYCNSILENHNIFENESVVDLDNLCTLEDRKRIFNYHLQERGISVCSDVYGCGLYSMLPICLNHCPKIDVVENVDTSLTICRTAFIEICISANDNDIGFPQACYLFCCDRYFIKQGRDYFKNTSKSMVNEVKRLYLDAFDKALSRYKYSVLVYVALNGCIDVEDVDHNFFTSILGNFEDKPNIKKGLLKNATRLMEGKYLTTTTMMPYDVSEVKRRKGELYGKFSMQHSTITDAVLISHGIDNEILSTCENDFFFRYFRPKGYRNSKETIPGVLLSDNEQIARKLVNISHDEKQSLKVGNYLNMVTLQCRNDELLKLFFQGVNANVAKLSCQHLFNGLTNHGNMSDIVKLHPDICRTFLIYGSSDIICRFCRPIGWVSKESYIIEVDGFALVVRLFCVLLGVKLTVITTEDTNGQYSTNTRDHYETPNEPLHVGKVDKEKQRQIGNFVYEKLIVHDFRGLVRLFLFLLLLQPYYIHPVIVMAFLDGLTNFGERKYVIEKYRRFFKVLVFKYGSIPTILKLCRPISLLEEDNLLLKVNDEKLCRKLCSFLKGKLFYTHVTKLFDENLLCPVTSLLIDYSYNFFFPHNFQKLYLEDIVAYIFKYGIKAKNRKFVSTVYNELTEGAEDNEELEMVIRRYVLFSQFDRPDECSYLLQFLSSLVVLNRNYPYIQNEFENPFESLLWKINKIELNEDSDLDADYDSDPYDCP